MQDRIPKYPGRIKLTPVAGQDNTYDMTRADEPAQAGTPLNKATLLTDETAQAIGLTSEDPTLDEALRGLLDKSPKVGDTLQTFRTDLGPNWALCNGDFFTAGDYPELASISPGLEQMISNYKTQKFKLDSNSSFYCDSYAEGDGWQAFSVRELVSSTIGGTYIKYSRDGFNTFVSKHIYGYNGTTYGRNAASCIRYVNGYWICLRSGGSSRPGALGAYYTKDITGEWTHGLDENGSNNPTYGKGIYFILDIWYESGMYYTALGGDGSTDTSGSQYAYIVSSASPGFESPSVTQVGGYSTRPYSFYRDEDIRMFLCGVNGAGTILYNNSSNPAGDYTSINIRLSDGTTPTIYTEYIDKYEGEYCIFSRSSQVINNTSHYAQGILHTSDVTIANNWECTIVGQYYALGSVSLGPLYRWRDKYFLVSSTGSRRWIGPSILSPEGWTDATLEISTIANTSIFRKKASQPLGNVAMVSDGTLCLVPQYAVPTLTSNGGLYQYIKVKEDAT